MQRQVVLVDEQDYELGTAEIYAAHQGRGMKHRALSVILYRKKSGRLELLLQKRSKIKPVFKQLWSNTCCTNLRPGDTYLERAVSRLDEEMGIKVKREDLRLIYKFSYEANDPERKGWCENELDAVIVGKWDGEVFMNPEETEDSKWIVLEDLRLDMQNKPDIYAPWLKMIIEDERFKREVR